MFTLTERCVVKVWDHIWMMIIHGGQKVMRFNVVGFHYISDLGLIFHRAIGRLEDISGRLEDPDGRKRPHLIDGVLEVPQVPRLVVAQRSLHVNILRLLEDDLLGLGRSTGSSLLAMLW